MYLVGKEVSIARMAAAAVVLVVVIMIMLCLKCEFGLRWSHIQKSGEETNTWVDPICKNQGNLLPRKNIVN